MWVPAIAEITLPPATLTKRKRVAWESWDTPYWRHHRILAELDHPSSVERRLPAAPTPVISTSQAPVRGGLNVTSPIAEKVSEMLEIPEAVVVNVPSIPDYR